MGLHIGDGWDDMKCHLFLEMLSQERRDNLPRMVCEEIKDNNCQQHVVAVFQHERLHKAMKVFARLDSLGSSS